MTTFLRNLFNPRSQNDTSPLRSSKSKMPQRTHLTPPTEERPMLRPVAQVDSTSPTVERPMLRPAAKVSSTPRAEKRRMLGPVPLPPTEKQPTLRPAATVSSIEVEPTFGAVNIHYVIKTGPAVAGSDDGSSTSSRRSSYEHPPLPHSSNYMPEGDHTSPHPIQAPRVIRSSSRRTDASNSVPGPTPAASNRGREFSREPNNPQRPAIKRNDSVTGKPQNPNDPATFMNRSRTTALHKRPVPKQSQTPSVTDPLTDKQLPAILLEIDPKISHDKGVLLPDYILTRWLKTSQGELRLTPDHFVDSCRRFTHSDELADLNKSLAPWYRIEWCGLNDGTGEREAMEAIAIYSAKTVEVLPLHDQRWVFGVFSSETLRRCVTTGQGLDYSLIETMSLCEARSMMILLDYGLRMSDWSSKHQRRFHRLIKKIGLHFGQSVLPQTFYLQNIIREGDHPIAGGGYADIFRGSYGSQPVCLKRLRVFLSSDSQEILQEFLNEAIIWRHLRHPNVLPFLGINQTVFPGQTCFVSRFLANGNLAVFLKKNPNHDRLSLLSQVAKGLQYLHSTHICHGDVKAANILIDENHQCYLADFGIAALISTKTATVGFATATRSTKGTMRWTAPELFSTPNTPASGIKAAPRDIYAFACTMLEVVTGKPPFSEMDDAPAMLAVIQGKRPPKPKSAHMTAELWQVIVRCWAQDPLERPKSNDIVTAFEHMISRGASHSS